MTSMPTHRLSLLALCLALAPAAHAGGFVGIGFGSVGYGYDSGECTADLGMSCEVDGNSSGGKLVAGLNPTPTSLVEISAYDLGTMQASVGGGLARVDEDVSAVALSIGGLVPLNDVAHISLKGGFFSSSLDATAVGPGGTATVSDDTSGILLGAGVLIRINDVVSARAEYEHFAGGGDSDSDIGLASASLLLTF